MDADFERLKVLTEKELGREIDADEQRHLKALYYFGKGVAFKNQLDGEPEQIGRIVERALEDIKGRMQQRRRGGVVGAVKDFLAGRSKRRKERGVEKEKEEIEFKALRKDQP